MIIRRFIFFCMSLSCAFARAGAGEVSPANEESDITHVVEPFESAGPNQNQLDHGKIHGCLHGQFGILDGLDPLYAQGLFKTGMNAYTADVRFANLSARGEGDQPSDVLSVSIKVHGVTGHMISSDPGESENQDFVFVTSPTANVANFLSDERAGHAKTTDAGSAARPTVKETLNPLEPHYWSQTPSKFGDNQAKFSLVPCAKGAFANSAAGPDRLRDNLIATMRAHPACFDFKVQLHNKPSAQPTESANSIWDETRAPFVAVARLWIKNQLVRTGPECDKLSFTPLHSLLELRPLGGVSRLREGHPNLNLDGQAQN